MPDLSWVPESKLNRARKRLERGAVSLVSRDPPTWMVAGDTSLDDQYDTYTVFLDYGEGKYKCTCHEHSYGGSRAKKVCTHVVAVMLWREAHSEVKFTSLPAVTGDARTEYEVHDEEVAVKPLCRAQPFFPFAEFREHQLEVLVEVEKALDAGKHVIMNAPTGFGKSPNALAHCREAGYAFYTTPLNSLVRQLEKDFCPKFMFPLIGKKNYPCPATHNRSAADGPCSYGVCPVSKGSRDCYQCPEACPCKVCPYKEAVKRAQEAPVVTTNLTLLMVAPFFDQRKLLVIDEAHALEGFVRSQVTVEFRQDRVEYPSPIGKSFEDYLEWLNACSESISKLVESLNEQVTLKLQAGIEPEREELHELKELDALMNKTTELLLDYQAHKEPWVFHEEKFYDKRKKQEVSKLVFQPVTAKRFLQALVFSKGERILLASATPPSPAEMGWTEDECLCIEVPSTFPLENRPIVRRYAGSMARKDIDRTLPKMADLITEVAEDADGGIFVHCHTFSIRDRLHALLLERGLPHAVQDSSGREESLKSWMAGVLDNTGPLTFLSVNMTDGVDLKDRVCRENLLCKLPFASLGDPVVAKRLELEGQEWYDKDVANKIAQAYGRGVRSKDDHAVFIIADECFEWFFRKNKKLFPKWFRDAVK